MITTVPSSIVQELHKLASEGAVLYLAHINMPADDLYLARNVEDVIWDSKTWSKFWFEIDPLSDTTSGEVPELSIVVSNIGGIIEQSLIDSDNLADSTVTLYFVNSKHLDETTPIFSVTFDVAKVSCDDLVCSIVLSAKNPMLLSFPPWKLHGSLCRYKKFPTDARCGYSGGVYTTCDRTFADCMDRGMYARFGGQLGLLTEVVDV